MATNLRRTLALHGWWMLALVVVGVIMLGGHRDEDEEPLQPLVVTPAQRAVLDALREVESGNRPSPPDRASGNIGPYQIGPDYWHDATGADPALRARSHADCRDRAYAERVVVAYMRRYCPLAWAAGDAEIIARTHNGGPRGPWRPNTRTYWDRVRVLLAAAEPSSAEPQPFAVPSVPPSAAPAPAPAPAAAPPAAAQPTAQPAAESQAASPPTQAQMPAVPQPGTPASSAAPGPAAATSPATVPTPASTPPAAASPSVAPPVEPVLPAAPAPSPQPPATEKPVEKPAAAPQPAVEPAQPVNAGDN